MRKRKQRNINLEPKTLWESPENFWKNSTERGTGTLGEALQAIGEMRGAASRPHKRQREEEKKKSNFSGDSNDERVRKKGREDMEVPPKETKVQG